MSNVIVKIEEKILEVLKKEEFSGSAGVIVRDLTSASLNLAQTKSVDVDTMLKNKK